MNSQTFYCYEDQYQNVTYADTAEAAEKARDFAVEVPGTAKYSDVEERALTVLEVGDVIELLISRGGGYGGKKYKSSSVHEGGKYVWLKAVVEEVSWINGRPLARFAVEDGRPQMNSAIMEQSSFPVNDKRKVEA